jgi:manganese/zinc/iron transport system substrate-binding protein
MRILSICLTVIITLAAGGCGGESEQQEDAQQSREVLEIVATTGMIADMVKNIGGHFVNVTTLVGPDIDPHLFIPGSEDIDRMLSADVLFYNGLDLEAGMADQIRRVSGSVRTVAVSGGLNREMLVRLDGPEDAYDPHIWFDVRMWMMVVGHVRDALAELDPEHADIFGADAEAYMDQLADLHDYVYSEAQFVPAGRRVLITSHRAFNYFGRAYGFDVRALQGISTEAHVSEAAIDDLADFIIARKIPFVFLERSVPPESIEDLKSIVADRGFEIEIGGYLYSDATGSPGRPQGTYIGMVQHNIQTIVLALRSDRDVLVP